MAPEQHLKRKYDGEKVDIFALGVILFVMMSMHPPFNSAVPSDQYYVALASEKYDIFWKKHSQNKPNKNDFYSPEFRDLFQKISLLDPDQRITIEDIKNHPWMN